MRSLAYYRIAPSRSRRLRREAAGPGPKAGYQDIGSRRGIALGSASKAKLPMKAEIPTTHTQSPDDIKFLSLFAQTSVQLDFVNGRCIVQVSEPSSKAIMEDKPKEDYSNKCCQVWQIDVAEHDGHLFKPFPVL